MDVSIRKPTTGAERLAAMQRREMERDVRLAQLQQEKADAKALADGVAETIGLSERRGERFTPVKAGASGARRKKDGLDWLYDKGRITHRQRLSGEKYGADWRKCQPPGPRSCIDDTVRGFGGNPLEAKAHAEAMISRARALALNGNQALSDACDVVCGAGLKPIDWAKGDDRLAGRYEERVQRALELLETYYFS